MHRVHASDLGCVGSSSIFRAFQSAIQIDRRLQHQGNGYHPAFKDPTDLHACQIGDGGVNDFARYCQVFMSWRSHYPNVDIQRLALSKLSTILFTAELQRILDRQNIPILTTCLHPGLVMTGMLTLVLSALFIHVLHVQRVPMI